MLISPDDASQEHRSQAGMQPHCKWHAEHQVESELAKWDNRGLSSYAQDGRKYTKAIWTKAEVLQPF